MGLAVRPSMMAVLLSAFLAVSVVAPSSSEATPSLGNLLTEGGAAFAFPFPSGGELEIWVQREVRPNGSRHLRIEVSRTGCEIHLVTRRAGSVDCFSLWSVKKRLPFESLHIDALLDQASIRTRVRGRILSVRWKGFGELLVRSGVQPPPSPGFTGYGMVESRDAVVAVRLGDRRWPFPAHPSPHQVYGGLFRRVLDVYTS